MNPILFSIGGFDIKWYSVLILIGVIIGYMLLQREATKHNYPKDFIFNLFFWAIISGFIGARIYYVVFNWSLYQSDPLSIFKIWEGGLAIHGGLLFGFFSIMAYCHKYNVNTFKVGQLSCIYLMWYSFGRFFIESLRTDSLMLGGFRMAQIVSIVLFVIALLAFMILSRKSKFEGLYSEPNNQQIRF